MCLDLQHADTVVELRDDTEVLVCANIVLFDEWGVVCADFCYVAVFSIAKLGIVITRLGVCWRGSGGSCGGGLIE